MPRLIVALALSIVVLAASSSSPDDQPTVAVQFAGPEGIGLKMMVGGECWLESAPVR